MIAVGVQVWPAGVADQQRISGEHEPRLIRAPAIGHEIRVMRERVPGRRDRLELRVAQRHDLAVGERMVIEADARSLGQVRGRPAAGDELGQPGDVVGLDVGLDDGGDLGALRFG
jgi:hypothetical protein